MNAEIKQLLAVQFMDEITPRPVGEAMYALEHAPYLAHEPVTEIHDGEELTFLFFRDQSVITYHWTLPDDSIPILNCFLLYAYVERKEIPQFILDNSDLIGTVRVLGMTTSLDAAYSSETIH